MMYISGNDFNDMYYNIFDTCRGFGTFMSPRGETTCELRPYIVELIDPIRSLYTGESRRLNFAFFAVECLSYISGWGRNKEHAELMLWANSSFKRYRQSDGLLIHQVCYGLQIKPGIERITSLFISDPYTRQAVIMIEDNFDQYLPRCTSSIQFVLSPKTGTYEIDMIVNMRSNDINWGLPYDLASFCTIQIALCECLGYRIGKCTHISGSMHYYMDKAPSIVKPTEEEYAPTVKGTIINSVPHNDIEQLWEAKTTKASHTLMSLHDHVIVRRKGKDSFVGPYESESYWRQWGNLIRHRWDPK